MCVLARVTLFLVAFLAVDSGAAAQRIPLTDAEGVARLDELFAAAASSVQDLSEQAEHVRDLNLGPLARERVRVGLHAASARERALAARVANPDLFGARDEWRLYAELVPLLEDEDLLVQAATACALSRFHTADPGRGVARTRLLPGLLAGCSQTPDPWLRYDCERALDQYLDHSELGARTLEAGNEAGPGLWALVRTDRAKPNLEPLFSSALASDEPEVWAPAAEVARFSYFPGVWELDPESEAGRRLRALDPVEMRVAAPDLVPLMHAAFPHVGWLARERILEALGNAAPGEAETVSLMLESLAAVDDELRSLAGRFLLHRSSWATGELERLAQLLGDSRPWVWIAAAQVVAGWPAAERERVARLVAARGARRLESIVALANDALQPEHLTSLLELAGSPRIPYWRDEVVLTGVDAGSLARGIATLAPESIEGDRILLCLARSRVAAERDVATRALAERFDRSGSQRGELAPLLESGVPEVWITAVTEIVGEHEEWLTESVRGARSAERIELARRLRSEDAREPLDGGESLAELLEYAPKKAEALTHAMHPRDRWAKEVIARIATLALGPNERFRNMAFDLLRKQLGLEEARLAVAREVPRGDIVLADRFARGQDLPDKWWEALELSANEALMASATYDEWLEGPAESRDARAKSTRSVQQDEMSAVAERLLVEERRSSTELERLCIALRFVPSGASLPREITDWFLSRWPEGKVLDWLQDVFLRQDMLGELTQAVSGRPPSDWPVASRLSFRQSGSEFMTWSSDPFNQVHQVVGIHLARSNKTAGELLNELENAAADRTEDGERLTVALIQRELRKSGPHPDVVELLRSFGAEEGLFVALAHSATETWKRTAELLLEPVETPEATSLETRLDRAVESIPERLRANELLRRRLRALACAQGVRPVERELEQPLIELAQGLDDEGLAAQRALLAIGPCSIETLELFFSYQDIFFADATEARWLAFEVFRSIPKVSLPAEQWLVDRLSGEGRRWVLAAEILAGLDVDVTMLDEQARRRLDVFRMLQSSERVDPVDLELLIDTAPGTTATGSWEPSDEKRSRWAEVALVTLAWKPHPESDEERGAESEALQELEAEIEAGRFRFYVSPIEDGDLRSALAWRRGDPETGTPSWAVRSKTPSTSPQALSAIVRTGAPRARELAAQALFDAEPADERAAEIARLVNVADTRVAPVLVLAQDNAEDLLLDPSSRLALLEVLAKAGDAVALSGLFTLGGRALGEGEPLDAALDQRTFEVASDLLVAADPELAEIGNEQLVAVAPRHSKKMVELVRRLPEAHHPNESRDVIMFYARAALKAGHADALREAIRTSEKLELPGEYAERLGEDPASWLESDIRAPLRSLVAEPEPSWWSRLPSWIHWAAVASVVWLLSQLLLAALVRPLPLFVLCLHDSVQGFGVPVPGGNRISLASFLCTGRRAHSLPVLDAWIRAVLPHVPRRDPQVQRPRLSGEGLRVSLPIVVGGKQVAVPRPSAFSDALRASVVRLSIEGEGGVGKSGLLTLLARWFRMKDPARALQSPVAIPVVLLRGSITNSLEEAILERLRPYVPASVPPLDETLLSALLRARRVVVLVDGLSEMKAEIRELVLRAPGDRFPVLITTSREEEPFVAGSAVRIEPTRIAPHDLSSFLHHYLESCGTRDLLAGERLHEASAHLGRLAGGERGVTVLFAKLFADQLVLGEGTDAASPKDEFDLVIAYVMRLGRSLGRDSLPALRDDAWQVSWAVVRETLRPSSISRQSLVSALADGVASDRTSAGQRVDRLHSGVGFLHQMTDGTLTVCLDPVAEHLAALHVASHYRTDAARWHELLDEIQAKLDRKPSDFLKVLLRCVESRWAGIVPRSVQDRIASLAEGDTAGPPSV